MAGREREVTQVNGYVADTHALYWYLIAGAQLGANALAALREGERGEARIYIPSIVLAELYYLNVKYGRPLDFPQEYERFARSGQFDFVDFRAIDVLQFEALASIPEMHDCIIAGVAYGLKIPCLTRDPAIVNSGLIQTVW